MQGAINALIEYGQPVLAQVDVDGAVGTINISDRIRSCSVPAINKAALSQRDNSGYTFSVGNAHCDTHRSGDYGRYGWI